MVKRQIITCDVKGCKEEGWQEVDCCTGWNITQNGIYYKKFEKPLAPNKVDLCKRHWIEWSKLTCKLLKMDKEGSSFK